MMHVLPDLGITNRHSARSGAFVVFTSERNKRILPWISAEPGIGCAGRASDLSCGCNQQLLRSVVLVISEVVDILESRRARRKLGWIQEIRIEGIVSCRRAIHHGTTLEHSHCLS